LGLDGVRSFLRRHRRIALDTSVFIYQVEANPRYLPLTDPVFAWLERRDSRAVTSTITMTELLAQPYRDSGQRRVDEFYGLLSTYPNLDWIAPNLEIADMAARLRAVHRLRTPDALQSATAVHAQATGFITNDSVFQRVDGFETLVLDQLL
jgi:predicted nucleic acid-binding protein